ncbi:hypothetical protein PMAYCL1PPCAC_08625, partial [Pristionchus mayeri]
LTFNYSSPLSWTYFATPAGGQSLNAAYAQKRINADIQFAVLNAFESFGYSTSGVVVNNAVQPENVQISADATCGACMCAAVDGVVTIKCAADQGTLASATLHSQLSSITVASQIALAQSNWETIAIKVWANLIVDAGVKFYGLIEVRA